MYIEYYDANGLTKTLGDIEHYNHNHDALGRFAGKVGGVSSKSVNTPRQYARKANKLEKLSAKGRGVAMTKENRAKKKERKGDKAAAKLNRAQAKTYREIAQKAEKSAKKTAAEAFVNKNYSVSEKIVRRNSKKKQDILISAGLFATQQGIPVVVGYNVGMHIKDNKVYEGRYKGENPRKVYGKKYSIKKTKNGNKSTYTEANRQYDRYGQLTKSYKTSTRTGQTIDKRKKKK